MFLSSASFFFTVIVGVAAFVLAAIHAPTELKQLIDAANVALNNFLSSYVEDRYSVLIGFVFDGKNVVLMGFILAARLLMSIIGSILNLGGAQPAPNPDARTTVGWGLWGRRR
jgi:hypothetical protein